MNRQPEENSLEGGSEYPPGAIPGNDGNPDPVVDGAGAGGGAGTVTGNPGAAGSSSSAGTSGLPEGDAGTADAGADEGGG